MVLLFLLRCIVMTRDAVVSGSVVSRNVHNLQLIHLQTRLQDRQMVNEYGKEERVATPPKIRKYYCYHQHTFAELKT